MATRDSTFRLKTESNPSGIDDVSRAFDRVEQAAKKLADPNLSPRQLQRGLVESALAADNLKTAMDAAKKSGENFGKEGAANLAKFEKVAESAAEKSARLRDALGDMKVKGDQSAQGFEKMAQFGGSAQGMMQGLADASKGTVGELGKLGLALFGFVEAAKLGWEAGKKLDEGMKAIGIDVGTVMESFIRAALGIEDLGKKINAWNVLTISAVALRNQHAVAMRAEAIELAKLGVATEGIVEKYRGAQLALDLFAKELANATKAGLSNSVVMKDLANAADAYFTKALAAGIINLGTLSKLEAERVSSLRRSNDAIHEAGIAQGGLTKAQWDQMKANDAAILSITKKSNADRDAIIQAHALADATKAASKAFNDQVNAVGGSMKKIAEKAASDKDAADVAIAAAIKERDAKIKALNDMELSEAEYTKRKREIVKEATQIIREESAKQVEADKTVVESTRALVTANDLNGASLKTMTEQYVSNEKAADDKWKKDKELQDIAKLLQEALSGTTGKIDEQSPAWKRLAEALDKVKEPASKVKAEAGDSKPYSDTAKAVETLTEKQKDHAKQLILSGQKLNEYKGLWDIYAEDIDTKLIPAMNRMIEKVYDLGKATKDAGGTPRREPIL